MPLRGDIAQVSGGICKFQCDWFGPSQKNISNNSSDSVYQLDLREIGL